MLLLKLVKAEIRAVPYAFPPLLLGVGVWQTGELFKPSADSSFYMQWQCVEEVSPVKLFSSRFRV